VNADTHQQSTASSQESATGKRLEGETPPFKSLERLEHDTNSDGVYTFTHPWSDGTTGIRL
jgi:hypothetical protein